MGQLSKVETSLDDLFHKFVLDPEETVAKKEDKEEKKSEKKLDSTNKNN